MSETASVAGDVTVEVAPESAKQLLAGLMQFYAYDFSELEPEGSDGLDFDARGLFSPYPHLDAYWREEGRRPLLIRVGGKPAGFALLNTFSHLFRPVDHNMGEFFVARKHRRRGVATRAFAQLVAMHPGRWEVAVLWRNKGALAFWPGAIAAAPGVSAVVEHRDDVRNWDGLVLSFLAAA
jgi:predicted acetyltransferase